MSETIFVINAPPLLFTKEDLYNSKFVKNDLNPFIKAIADSFFLSNNFRKNNKVYFNTQLGEETFQVIFNGDKLRYLGPSFFSAGHLLLRAKNNIINPNSKKGKLTLGLSINKGSIDDIFDRYDDAKFYQITTTNTLKKNYSLDLSDQVNLFLYGFTEFTGLNHTIIKFSLGPIEIDEQIIMTNFLIDRVI